MHAAQMFITHLSGVEGVTEFFCGITHSGSTPHGRRTLVQSLLHGLSPGFVVLPVEWQ